MKEHLGVVCRLHSSEMVLTRWGALPGGRH